MCQSFLSAQSSYADNGIIINSTDSKNSVSVLGSSIKADWIKGLITEINCSISTITQDGWIMEWNTNDNNELVLYSNTSEYSIEVSNRDTDDDSHAYNNYDNTNRTLICNRSSRESYCADKKCY